MPPKPIASKGQTNLFSFFKKPSEPAHAVSPSIITPSPDVAVVSQSNTPAQSYKLIHETSSFDKAIASDSKPGIATVGCEKGTIEKPAATCEHLFIFTVI